MRKWLRFVWWRAWKETRMWAREYLGAEWTVIVATAVIAVIATPGGMFERIAAGVVAGVAAFVIGAVMLFIYHLSRSPAAIYERQNKIRRAIKAGASRRVRRAESERDDARALLSGRQANPVIVNALLPKLKYGIHEIANRVKESGSDEWKAKFRVWEHETKELLEQLGCAELEVASFWDFTEGDLRRLGDMHENKTVNHRLQWAQFRINALRRIINSYADSPVLD